MACGETGLRCGLAAVPQPQGHLGTCPRRVQDIGAWEAGVQPAPLGMGWRPRHQPGVRPLLQDLRAQR